MKLKPRGTKPTNLTSHGYAAVYAPNSLID